MAKDYYKILGVEKTASDEEIKSAFRKLAHKHHPDKNQNNKESEAKFKEINEAYQELGDKTKRSQYDRFGSAGPQGSGGFGGFDSSGFGGFDFNDVGDIFSDFFGGQSGFGGSRRQKRGADMEISINISLKESFFGVTREVQINKTNVCSECSGTRADKKSSLIICSVCSGAGYVQKQARSFLGIVNTQAECGTCLGTGKIPDKKCQNCKGQGTKDSNSKLSIQVPAGIEHGQTLRMTGAGEATAGGLAGDMFIHILVDRDNAWQRVGANLEKKIQIKLSEALLGTEIEIDTFSGMTKVAVPQGTNTGDTLTIKSKGFSTNRGNGDMILRLNIAIPKKLDSKQKEYIQKLKESGI